MKFKINSHYQDLEDDEEWINGLIKNMNEFRVETNITRGHSKTHDVTITSDEINWIFEEICTK